MANVKFILDSTFLSDQSERYFQKAKFATKKDKIDLITEVAGEIYSKAKNYNPAKVKFTTNDEDEIKRGDSYRISDDMPAIITLDEFRLFLAKKKIPDKKRQDFILYVLLQTQLGLSFKAVDMVNPLLMSLHPHLKANALTNSKISFECGENGETYIHLKLPIDGTNERYEAFAESIGYVTATFTLSVDNRLTMAPMIIELQEREDFSLQFIHEKLQIKAEDLATLNISKPTNLIDEIFDFIRTHRAAFSFGAAGILGILGILLSLTGVFSVAGMFMMAFSIKLSFIGIAAIDAGLYLGLTGFLGKLFQTATNAIFNTSTKKNVITYHINPSAAAYLMLHSAAGLVEDAKKSLAELQQVASQRPSVSQGASQVCSPTVGPSVSTFYAPPPPDASPDAFSKSSVPVLTTQTTTYQI